MDIQNNHHHHHHHHHHNQNHLENREHGLVVSANPATDQLVSHTGRADHSTMNSHHGQLHHVNGNHHRMYFNGNHEQYFWFIFWHTDTWLDFLISSFVLLFLAFTVFFTLIAVKPWLEAALSERASNLKSVKEKTGFRSSVFQQLLYLFSSFLRSVELFFTIILMLPIMGFNSYLFGTLLIARFFAVYLARPKPNQAIIICAYCSAVFETNATGLSLVSMHKEQSPAPRLESNACNCNI